MLCNLCKTRRTNCGKKPAGILPVDSTGLQILHSEKRGVKQIILKDYELMRKLYVVFGLQEFVSHRWSLLIKVSVYVLKCLILLKKRDSALLSQASDTGNIIRSVSKYGQIVHYLIRPDPENLFDLITFAEHVIILPLFRRTKGAHMTVNKLHEVLVSGYYHHIYILRFYNPGKSGYYVIRLHPRALEMRYVHGIQE